LVYATYIPFALAPFEHRPHTPSRRRPADLPSQAVGRLESGASLVPFSVPPLKRPSSTVA
jgi:hypothetical protein